MSYVSAINTTVSYITSEATKDGDTQPSSLSVQFIYYTFLLLDIVSVPCSFIIFYYFIRSPELRHQRESNHLIIHLLIGTSLVTAVDVPLIIPYLQNHYYIASMAYPTRFCIFWIMYDYGMYSVNLWLMAFTGLERYLQIFHKQVILKNRIIRFCFYYLSSVLIITIVFFWYLYLVALYPCDQSQFDVTQMLCGFPCYKIDTNILLQNIDWIFADLLPLFLAVFFILLLLAHTLYQRIKANKHLIQQSIWKRTRKMILQLLPIATIFLIFNLPLITVGLLAISNPWYNTTPYFYANCLSYGLALCMPFAILSKQKLIRKRFISLVRPNRMNRTTPQTRIVIPLHKFKQTVAISKMDGDT
ncbi:unnamed protein product [Adineta ricciae]|uniref:G-protein coupled receptors family 1 profile domain-containing protein n=1 Tax=Adineta ricciae TaxID=249248 RepID=A0A814TJE4_ADIRI|nr:unnamed protein product [Adineta ricciae]